MRRDPQFPKPRRTGSKSDSANTLILPVTSALHPISVMQDYVYESMRKGNNTICWLENGQWTVSYPEHGEAAATYRALRLLLPEDERIKFHESDHSSKPTLITFPEDYVVKLTVKMGEVTQELDRIKAMYLRSTELGKAQYASIEDRMARAGLISPIDAQTMYRLRTAYQKSLGEGEVPSNRGFVTAVQSAVDTLEQGQPLITATAAESVFHGILLTTMNKVHEARGEALANIGYRQQADGTAQSIERLPNQFVDVVEHAVRGMPRHFMGMPSDTRDVPPNPYIPEGIALGR